ncbi:unnamed protein product [Psylliodes chrysocephalus]|uniref:Uncharacterized protein n=1 Tax=Psylliodes chrysocephalus TaxID=3402493 RepID=A0A9P0G832_9CUCU|nr:unnamed protein product [Psylliodes chrysocephala]
MNNLLTPRSAPVGRPKLPFSDKNLKSQKLKLSRENEHDSSLIEDVISRITTGKHQVSATLVASYGFDGSSGHSEYKQKFLNETEGSQDSSVFPTTLIPLRLTTSNGVVIWNNLTLQSLRFCIPIKLQYVKETKEHMNEKNS